MRSMNIADHSGISQTETKYGEDSISSLPRPSEATEASCQVEKVNSTLALAAMRKGICRLDKLDIGRGINFRAEVRQFEIELIKRALKITKGNQYKAAQLLGLKHTTLNHKVRQFNLPVLLPRRPRKS